MTSLKQLEFDWQFYFLIKLEIGFLTSISCNTLWKKSQYVSIHGLLFLVVPKFSDIFVFFLTFSLWKLLIYLLFMWGLIFQAPYPPLFSLAPLKLSFGRWVPKGVFYGIFTWRLSPDQNYGRIYPWVNS